MSNLAKYGLSELPRPYPRRFLTRSKLTQSCTKRGIGDDTGLDITTVTHQLNVLKKNGYVSVKRTNGERWFITEQGKKLLKDTSGESSDLSQ